MSYDWMVDERSDHKREDYLSICQQLDFDLTHCCNLSCHNCNIHANQSNFNFLNFRDYLHVVSCIINPDDIQAIKITGGEPLMHPRFLDFVNHMMQSFKNASIMIHTNGIKLPQFDLHNHELFNHLNFRLSEYLRINDKIIKQYEQVPNIYIYRWRGKFYDSNFDPNLSDEIARIVRERCNFSIRIIGRDLYGCCLSYPVEQKHKLAGIHIPFTPLWKEDWLKLETWRACKHCPMAVLV